MAWHKTKIYVFSVRSAYYFEWEHQFGAKIIAEEGTSNINHGRLEYSRYYTNINEEWVHNSTKSGVLFSFANGAYEFSVEFCVVKFSSFW